MVLMVGCRTTPGQSVKASSTAVLLLQDFLGPLLFRVWNTLLRGKFCEDASNRGKGRGRGACMLILVIFKIHQAHLACQEPSGKWCTHIRFLMQPSERGSYH